MSNDIPDEPRHKHEYVPWYSYGNVVSTAAIILTIVISSVTGYIVLRVSTAVATEQIAALQKADTRIDARVDKVEASVNELSDKAQDMVVKQAAMMANIEMLVRAEGLRPITAESIRARGE